MHNIKCSKYSLQYLMGKRNLCLGPTVITIFTKIQIHVNIRDVVIFWYFLNKENLIEEFSLLI